MPGKNVKPLNGKRLLEYTFESAHKAVNLQKIIISTNDALAAQTAFAHNIEVPFIRPEHLALDHTPTYDVVLHAIEFLESIDEHFDLICLLQPTCPFRNEGFIDECIQRLIETGADSLCSVMQVPHQYNPHWVFEADGSGFMQIATGDEKLIPSRQLLPPAFARDGSVYVFRTEVIKEHKNLYGNKITYLESQNQWHVNIDTKDDWAKAEMIANVRAAMN